MCNWITDLKRSDGVELVLGLHGWTIRAPFGRGVTRQYCPCCARPLTTAKAARACADEVFPFEPPPSAVVPFKQGKEP